jgi:hypothetical protein
MTKTTDAKILAPGKYWVGDPCYAGGKIQNWEAGETMVVTTIAGDGLAVNTANGDGTYDGDNGKKYPVDSGMLGAVPAGDGPCPDLMTEVTWKTAQIVERNDEGVVTVGTIEIETDPKTYCDNYWCQTEIEEGQDYCADCAEEED